jgi:aryl-alcohol dehydrogenase-like predicted oxidoreductase
VAESAGAIKRLIDEGKVLAAGASNMNVAELEAFARECPLSAFQPPYNMLQRQIEADTLPWCRERGVAVLVYWPLLKGLLAGKMRPEQTFDNDSRRKYPQYQGEEWTKNLALVEKLRTIATEAGRTVAELVLRWTLQQPGITGVLCGARRAEQVRENAGGSGWELTPDELARIDRVLAERGPATVRYL